MGPLAKSLASSPELFPFALDLPRDTVTVLRLTRSDYERASFLDGRIAGPGRAGRTLPFAELAEAVEESGLSERCDFIFHLGHVGSTLLSRLLGQHPAIFALREPEILRTLAQASDSCSPEEHLPVFLKLWSRTFDQSARAVVKATSFVSELALRILTRPYAPRAIAMGVKPETYLATIFGGENAPTEVCALAPFRLARLERRLHRRFDTSAFGIGEWVALSWVCEATALAAAKHSAGDRVMVIDFDHFLAHSEEGLARAFAHLRMQTEAEAISRILAGPEMRTYSKAPQHAYDSALRNTVLNQGRNEFAADIRQGLEWLRRTARKHAQVREAVEMFPP